MGILTIREAVAEDFDQIWAIFHEVVSAGDTYAYPPETDYDQAFKIWMSQPRKTFIAREDGEILGTYYLKTNQGGPGKHVCNCGYMVSSTRRGQGIATAMCEHSQQIALKLRYEAMQFNFVAESNQGAIRLWTRLGFDTIGRLPRAFNHPQLGYIDALVMYKWLDPSP